MADTLAVADRFLCLARDRGHALTPMQLLKLVYIAHGWMLGLYSRPLIKDEVQAWKYGPVIPRLYDAVRSYKGRPIDGSLSGSGELDRTEESIVQQVYSIYGHLSGAALSRLTHAAGTPWAHTYIPDRFGLIIPTDLIVDHYQRLASERGHAA